MPDKIGFDGLARKVEKEYIERGYSEERARKIGEATAGKVYHEQMADKMAKGGAVKGANRTYGSRFGVVVGSMRFIDSDEDMIEFDTRTKFDRYGGNRIIERRHLFRKRPSGKWYAYDVLTKEGHGVGSGALYSATSMTESIDRFGDDYSKGFSQNVHKAVARYARENTAKGQRVSNLSDYITNKNVLGAIVTKDGKGYSVEGDQIIDGVYVKKEGGGTIGLKDTVYIPNRDVVRVDVMQGKNERVLRHDDILDGLYVDKRVFKAKPAKKKAAPKAASAPVGTEKYDKIFEAIALEAKSVEDFMDKVREIKDVPASYAQAWSDKYRVKHGDLHDTCLNYITKVKEKHGKGSKAAFDPKENLGAAKKGNNGWSQVSYILGVDGYDWKITTSKNSSGDLSTSAFGGKYEDKGGYNTFSFKVIEDPVEHLERESIKRVTQKEVEAQHEKALNKFRVKKKFEHGGEVHIVNEDVKFDRGAYGSVFGDYDGDGVPNIDDKNPLDPTKKGKIEQVSAAKSFGSLLDLKAELDDVMYDSLDILKKKSPKDADLYARTKTPYSIIKKLVDKRLMDPKKGLTDLVGTTVAVSDYKDLQKVRKNISSGALGEVIEEEDMYLKPKGGYMAHHFIINVKGIPVEVQLKTKRMKNLNAISHEFYKDGNLNQKNLLKLTALANKADKGDKAAIKEYDSIMKDKEKVATMLKS